MADEPRKVSVKGAKIQGVRTIGFKSSTQNKANVIMEIVTMDGVSQYFMLSRAALDEVAARISKKSIT